MSNTCYIISGKRFNNSIEKGFLKMYASEVLSEVLCEWDLTFHQNAPFTHQFWTAFDYSHITEEGNFLRVC